MEIPEERWIEITRRSTEKEWLRGGGERRDYLEIKVGVESGSSNFYLGSFYNFMMMIMILERWGLKRELWIFMGLLYNFMKIFWNVGFYFWIMANIMNLFFSIKDNLERLFGLSYVLILVRTFIIKKKTSNIV